MERLFALEAPVLPKGALLEILVIQAFFFWCLTIETIALLGDPLLFMWIFREEIRRNPLHGYRPKTFCTLERPSTTRQDGVLEQVIYPLRYGSESYVG